LKPGLWISELAPVDLHYPWSLSSSSKREKRSTKMRKHKHKSAERSMQEVQNAKLQQTTLVFTVWD
jgi:hypothetical protein